MSNIVIRRNPGRSIAPSYAPSYGEAEPWRWLRDVVRWDPFREMAPLVADENAGVYLPAFEVKETKDAFIFRADLPGVEEKDLDIQLTGNRLTVTGKREAEQEEKTDAYFVYERSFGTFTRSFTLPDGADAEHVRAELKQGVLNLVLPKLPERLPKKVIVATTEGPKSTKS